MPDSANEAPSVRLRRYLDLARVARNRAAETCDPLLAKSYGEIAMGWEALAHQLESHS